MSPAAPKKLDEMAGEVEPVAKQLKDTLLAFASAKERLQSAEWSLQSAHNTMREAERQLEKALARLEKLRTDVVFAVAPKGEPPAEKG